ncbi:hypothetical protein GW17_00012527 [Ensete ventricosum]|nr:hypothetical protein GW17_00012527 [Ensete ventricosum]
MNCLYRRMSKTLERYQHWCYASQDPNVANRNNAQMFTLVRRLLIINHIAELVPRNVQVEGKVRVPPTLPEVNLLPKRIGSIRTPAPFLFCCIIVSLSSRKRLFTVFDIVTSFYVKAFAGGRPWSTECERTATIGKTTRVCTLTGQAKKGDAEI